MKTTRRDFLRVTGSLAAGAMCAPGLLAAEPTSSIGAKKNVLFIMADDFNYWIKDIGYYDQARTPAVDALAARGIVFSDAHCSSPVCNPSRNALWSGKRPTTSGIDANEKGFIREKPGFENVVTMNQCFMQNGYYVYGGGKLYHPGRMDPDNPAVDAGNWSGMCTISTGAMGGAHYKFEPKIDRLNLFRWSAGNGDVEKDGDRKLARHMATFLRDYKRDKPFFCGVGFFRPHLPWQCNKKFFDMFDPADLKIPKGYKAGDLDDVPGEKPYWHLELLKHDKDKWQEGIRAYLACLAFADSNVKIVMDALNDSPYKDNTIVCFMGDHGWHLGEKDRWSKHSRFIQSNRTTLIIYDPGAKGNGSICRKTVSLQDLYPTLMQLTGLSSKPDVEGRSLAPLLQDPNRNDWNGAALSTLSGVNMLKTEKWRFVDNPVPEYCQLYDMTKDPHEWTNLYGNPEYEDTVRMLRAQIERMIKLGKQMQAGNAGKIGADAG